MPSVLVLILFMFLYFRRVVVVVDIKPIDWWQ